MRRIIGGRRRLPCQYALNMRGGVTFPMLKENNSTGVARKERLLNLSVPEVLPHCLRKCHVVLNGRVWVCTCRPNRREGI